MLKLISLLIVVSSPALAETPELELVKAQFAQSEHELSGFALSGKDLVLIADDKEDHCVYKAVFQGKRYQIVKALDLTQVPGFKEYQESLARETRIPEKDRRIDFEGIAVCGDKTYLINERVRQVVLIEGGKKLSRLPIDFDGYAPLFEGGANAGFEGLTVDCATGTMYVAKEREPRQIFVVDLKANQVVKNTDFPASERAGQKVINPFTGQGLFEVGPDISDLAFDGGFLYVLERNSYEVTKLDPKTFDVKARVSFFKTEKPLYETGEPFGEAEALRLTPDEIMIGVDNNGTPLTHFAKKTYGVKGKVGVIMTFKRPKGF